MPRLTIDGRAVEVADTATILDAATSAGIDVPTVCADPRLVPSGACRVCVVTVDGRDRPVTACTMPVHDGMTVETATPALVGLRRTLLELLARDHPAGAVTAAPSEPFIDSSRSMASLARPATGSMRAWSTRRIR